MAKPKHEITVDGKQVPLTSTEFKLFEYLRKQPGVLVTPEQVIKDVFPGEAMVFDRAINTHVKILKKKLAKADDCIEIIRATGYRFKETT